MGGSSGSGTSVGLMRNILNGVVSCKWDKTSYSPSLLEIVNTSEVKFNIDSLNPLILNFADGWDNIDQPKGIVKQLSVAPNNIDFSAKTNRRVQIVAKIVNDEVVITTHDLFDPSIGAGSNIIPTFSSNTPTNGWTISASLGTDAWKAVDNNDATYWYSNSYVSPQYLYITAPTSVVLDTVSIKPSSTFDITFQGYDEISSVWDTLATKNAAVNSMFHSLTIQPTGYSQYRVKCSYSTSVYYGLFGVNFYEAPATRYYKSINKVKDILDVEQYWINLGYVAVDGSGNITALTHYTDLRNNYPGGMRVES